MAAIVIEERRKQLCWAYRSHSVWACWAAYASPFSLQMLPSSQIHRESFPFHELSLPVITPSSIAEHLYDANFYWELNHSLPQMILTFFSYVFVSQWDETLSRMRLTFFFIKQPNPGHIDSASQPYMKSSCGTQVTSQFAITWAVDVSSLSPHSRCSGLSSELHRFSWHSHWLLFKNLRRASW